MESEEQLKIFMEINENQKAVSPSLRLDLEEDLYWQSPRLDSRMKALRSSVIKALSGNSNYVLYNKISVGEDSADLAFKPFDTALGKSGLIPRASSTQWVGDMDICIYNANETDIDKAMKEARKKIAQFIDGGYSIADQNMDENIKNDYLFSNRGTFAFITLLGSIHKYLIKTNVISPTSSINERIKAITPYISSLANKLNNLTDEESVRIKGILGQGAETFWLRSYQNFINKIYQHQSF
jgi:DNA sulfur modification protein DndB